jgi:hypothetical protein
MNHQYANPPLAGVDTALSSARKRQRHALVLLHCLDRFATVVSINELMF